MGEGETIGKTKVTFEDNSDKFLGELQIVKRIILEKFGIMISRFAKKLCPVGTVESTGIKGYRGGTLRNSITYEVDVERSTVSVGTNVEYGPYVELGTGPYFEPPPDWETFDAPQGSGIGRGYVRARPFLRPAVQEHVREFKDIAITELED